MVAAAILIQNHVLNNLTQTGCTNNNDGNTDKTNDATGLLNQVNVLLVEVRAAVSLSKIWLYSKI
jgi:hypothetical protein